jgi:succinate dehydrogenase flavin-adding protein (antitoxin of CptAB toxin-antitoxin module)
MEAIFYFHLNSVNLAQYFGCACFKPSKYLRERTEDIQSAHPDFLVLSTKSQLYRSDTAVELILTNNETKELIEAKRNNSFYFFPKPLPISRVRAVYFESEELRDKITTLINLSTAFIPKRLTKVFNKREENEFDQDLTPNIGNGKDNSENIKKYDSLLGGFALMKLAREHYMNYSENYFSTLSFFNTAIEAELLKSKKVSTIYHDAFVGKDLFKSIYQYLYRDINEEDINAIAKLENQKIRKDKITGLIDISSLERATYILTVLYLYGVGNEGRKLKVDGLILNNFQKHIKIDRAEVVALCYGLNRGYAVFSSKYNNNGSEQLVKFELDSKVDYYTIESIYQFAFNNDRKSETFPYLDQIIPNIQTQGKKRSRSDYYIFDKLVITERIKVGEPKWWNKFLAFFFQKNQEELFKPFLIIALQKIKDDLEDEFNSILEIKDEEIMTLRSENSELIRKISDAENNVPKAQNFKKQTTNILATPVVLSDEIPSENQSLLEKIRNYDKFIHILESQTKMKETKKLIFDFNQKNAVENNLFPPGN